MDDTDDLTFEIELRQEIESLESKIGHIPPLTNEEIENIIPIELSADERIEIIENREKALGGDSNIVYD
jgi:hypothetical protein